MVALILGLSVELFCWGCLGVVGMLLLLVEPVMPLVEGPGGELTVFESCFDVVQFLVHAVLSG